MDKDNERNKSQNEIKHEMVSNWSLLFLNSLEEKIKKGLESYET